MIKLLERIKQLEKQSKLLFQLIAELRKDLDNKEDKVEILWIMQ